MIWSTAARRSAANSLVCTSGIQRSNKIKLRNIRGLRHATREASKAPLASPTKAILAKDGLNSSASLHSHESHSGGLGSGSPTKTRAHLRTNSFARIDGLIGGPVPTPGHSLPAI